MTKYKAKRTEYNGKRYDSKKEARYAQRCDLLKMAGEIKEIEEQPKFDMIINGVKVGYYKADFKLIYPDGRQEIVDVKGVRTPMYKLKKKIVEAIYGIEIIEA